MRMNPFRGSRPMTVVLIVALGVTIVLIIVAVVLANMGGLPSAADCQANPNLFGC